MKTLRDFWLGWKDLNPRNDGVRVHCLTAWLHPNICFICRIQRLIQYTTISRTCQGFPRFFYELSENIAIYEKTRKTKKHRANAAVLIRIGWGGRI